jgi:hypothetical protein
MKLVGVKRPAPKSDKMHTKASIQKYLKEDLKIAEKSTTSSPIKFQPPKIVVPKFE